MSTASEILPLSPKHGPQSDDDDDHDMSLIQYNLFLTPEQRLRQLEEFAEFILTARRLNGVATWSDSEKSFSD